MRPGSRAAAPSALPARLPVFRPIDRSPRPGASPPGAARPFTPAAPARPHHQPTATSSTTARKSHFEGGIGRQKTSYQFPRQPLLYGFRLSWS